MAKLKKNEKKIVVRCSAQDRFNKLDSKVVYSKKEAEKLFQKMNKEIEDEQRQINQEQLRAQKKAEEIILNF